jgi:hypothetical protein
MSDQHDVQSERERNLEARIAQLESSYQWRERRGAAPSGRPGRLALAAIALVAITATATKYVVAQQSPPSRTNVPYRGILKHSGIPVPNGTKSMSFSLYDQATGGNQVWGPETKNVAVADGVFSVALGETSPLNDTLLQTPSLWLDISVDNQPLTPRQQFLAAPYALHATMADTATNASHASTADTATNASHASTADTATNTSHATMADTATNASHASTADNATNASDSSHATNADSCQYLAQPGSHTYHEIWDAKGNLNFYVDQLDVLAFKANWGNVKNFIIDHPFDRDRYLIHTTLEGPENAVFYRGSARLHGGLSEVSLPAYFEAATRASGRTVLLTPKFESSDDPVSALAARSIRCALDRWQEPESDLRLGSEGNPRRRSAARHGAQAQRNRRPRRGTIQVLLR